MKNIATYAIASNTNNASITINAVAQPGNPAFGAAFTTNANSDSLLTLNDTNLPFNT